MAQRDTISLDKFSTEIGSILSMYSKNVSDVTEEWLSKTAKATAQELRQTSPVGRSAKYAKGWTFKKRDGKWIVHNKSAPGLAHLLEHGHPIVRGGVVIGTARAFPHIKKAENNALDKVSELIEEIKRIKV